jgi:hypothetical protein
MRPVSRAMAQLMPPMVVSDRPCGSAISDVTNSA